MKTSWQVSRTAVARDDGDRRWDYAYQFLLQWAMEQQVAPCPAPSHPQEDYHGHCPLCPCVDHPATTAADH
jgi:hypothetical protein